MLIKTRPGTRKSSEMSETVSAEAESREAEKEASDTSSSSSSDDSFGWGRRHALDDSSFPAALLLKMDV